MSDDKLHQMMQFIITPDSLNFFYSTVTGAAYLTLRTRTFFLRRLNSPHITGTEKSLGPLNNFA